MVDERVLLVADVVVDGAVGLARMEIGLDQSLVEGEDLVLVLGWQELELD